MSENVTDGAKPCPEVQFARGELIRQRRINNRKDAKKPEKLIEKNNLLFKLLQPFSQATFPMILIEHPVILNDVWEKRLTDFVKMMKAVVDIERKIIAVDAEMYSDLETILLNNGSLQSDLWGVNIYPMKKKFERIEYTALINIRPSQGNRGMEILDESVKYKIDHIIDYLLI